MASFIVTFLCDWDSDVFYVAVQIRSLATLVSCFGSPLFLLICFVTSYLKSIFNFQRVLMRRSFILKLSSAAVN